MNSMNSQIKPFALTFLTIPTNSPSSPFPTFCASDLVTGWFFKLFWHHWLCLAHQGQQLIPDYCLSLPDPWGMTPSIKSGLCLLWPQQSLSVCGEMPTSKLTIQRASTSSAQRWLWHTPGLWGDLCSCRHSALEAKACLCYPHNKRTVC